MSQSNWKDLPDWENADDYAFLDGQPPVVWAWEFLRRHPMYRRYWKRLSDCKTKVGADWENHPCATVYRPRKKPGESDEAWQRRVGYGMGKHPTKMALESYLGKKWLLRSMYDPSLPYTHGVRFPKPKQEFPHIVSTPEEFLELVEDEELEGGAGFQRVKSRYAVVVYDLTQKVDAQTKTSQKMLMRVQDEMKKAERIVVASSSSPKTGKWKRHLRAIDARRAIPPATYAEITRVLEGDDDSSDYLHNRGGKILTAARKVTRNYRNILKHSGTPGKNKNY